MVGLADFAQHHVGEQFWITLCDRPAPAKNTADGIRAVSGRALVTAGDPDPAGAAAVTDPR